MISIHDNDEYLTGEFQLMLDAYSGGESLGTFICQVCVYRPSIDGMIPAGAEPGAYNRAYEYTGEAFKPEVVLEDMYGFSLVEGRDYELSYTDNVKVGVAKVLATPKGACSPDGFAEWFFAITPPKAELAGLTAGPGELTVSVKDQSAIGTTGYEIQYREAGTDKWLSEKVKAGSSSYTVSGLDGGKKYEVRVCGVLDVEDIWDYYGFIDKCYSGEFSGIMVSDPLKTSISGASVGGLEKQTYTGKEIRPAVTVKLGSETLKAGTDYTADYKDNTNAGTATVTVTGKGKYGGSVKGTFTIAKAANPLKIRTASKSYKSKKLTKAASFGIGASKAQGKVTYTPDKKAKKAGIKVNSKGKVTVPKKCKKGTYKITVKASGNSNYLSGKKTVTIRVTA